MNKMEKKLENLLIEIEEIATEMAMDENYPAETRQRMFEKLKSLCEFYLDSDSSGREEIRQDIHSIKGGIKLPSLIYIVPGAMYSFINYAADNIGSANGLKWFKLGLTAASMEEGILDSRDLSMALGYLNERAKKAGIKTKGHVEAMIKISTSKAAESLKILLN